MVIALLLFLTFLALFVSADTPLGSMVIYGNNGTVVTGSRNVFLNLSYSAGHGIDKCRWANDDMSYLASADWEGCTTVKAWILSGGFGNKTVYFEVKDLNGDTAVFNDSILYVFMQDYTPPSPPTVYDGTGDDIDWSNSNSTLNANWFNASDDISTIYYKYRIINQTGCYDPSCAWTDVGIWDDVSAPGLTLYEGANYSFEILAYVNGRLNASAVSNGTIIDLTKPDAPGINSSSHPDQSRPEDSATAIFNFSASDPVSNGASSGIRGYSYVLDRHPGTAPDNVLEERAWNDLVPLHRGSQNQTLKMNGTGMSYSVYSQLGFNVTENDSLKVRVALAEQFSDYWDPMAVKVFIAKDVGSPIPAPESAAITNIINISQDIDYAYQMTDARIYEFDLTVNETVDITSTDIYVVVAGLPSDDDNRQPLAISATTDLNFVDNTTKSHVCDESACTENTNTVDYSIGVQRKDSGDYWTVQYDFLGDAVYYFHAKAKDNAGNWGDPAHYKITVAAGGVSSMIYSPVDNEAFVTNGSATNITVKVAVSGNTSAWVVALHPGGSNSTSPQAVFDSTHDFENITLEIGRNELYAMTNTSVGAMARSESVFVTLSSEPQPPTDKTLKVSYAGCTQFSSGNFLCYDDGQPGVYVGMGIEDNSAVSSGAVQADTEMNSIKIFMTRPFNVESRDLEFEKNEFLDRVNPMFGYKYGANMYVIKNELRYEDIYLGGGFFLPPGAYSIYIRKSGVMTDGRYNVTLTVK